MTYAEQLFQALKPAQRGEVVENLEKVLETAMEEKNEEF